MKKISYCKYNKSHRIRWFQQKKPIRLIYSDYKRVEYLEGKYHYKIFFVTINGEKSLRRTSKKTKTIN